MEILPAAARASASAAGEKSVGSLWNFITASVSPRGVFPGGGNITLRSLSYFGMSSQGEYVIYFSSTSTAFANLR